MFSSTPLTIIFVKIELLLLLLFFLIGYLLKIILSVIPTNLLNPTLYGKVNSKDFNFSLKIWSNFLKLDYIWIFNQN